MSNPAQAPLAYFYGGKMDATFLFYSDYTTLNDCFIFTDTRPAFAVGIDNSLSPFTPYRSTADGRRGFGH